MTAARRLATLVWASVATIMLWVPSASAHQTMLFAGAERGGYVVDDAAVSYALHGGGDEGGRSEPEPASASVVADALGRAGLGVALLAGIVATIGIARRDNSVADVFWGPTFAVAGFAALTAIPGESRGARTALVLTLVTVWATRLAAHIASRRQREGGEDRRYAEWRRSWGRGVWLRSLLQVYLLQAFLAFVGSTAVFVVLLGGDQRIDAFAIIGALVWATGFTLEVVADLQLARFLARKRAGLASGMCTEGLWSRSRHPNYFGEAVAWWGISIIALGVPFGWIGLVSGALVTALVRFVSGVPILERSWRDRPGFEAWARTTPVFVPRLSRPSAPTHDSPEENHP